MWLAAVLGIRLQAAVCVPLTALVIFLRLFRVGDILVPMYFFRPFNLYLDSRFLPDLIHLLYTTLSRPAFIFRIAAAAFLLIGITWLVQLAFKIIWGYLASLGTHSWIPGVPFAGLLLLSSLLPGTPPVQNPLLARGFFDRVVEEFDFIVRFIEDPALIVILGDHQPNVQLTGENQLSSVPVHVISRGRDFLKPFQNRGFRPGLIPDQPPPHRGMENFLFDFLEDFSTPRQPAQSGSKETRPG